MVSVCVLPRNHGLTSLRKRIFFRLCRPMCGRSVTVRDLPIISAIILPGAMPQNRGPAPMSYSQSLRWGKAATAHQTAEPQGI